MEWFAVFASDVGSKLPWALLVGVVTWVARMWAVGTIVHRREYEALRDDRDRWRDLALKQNPILGAAVKAIKQETRPPEDAR